MRRQKHLDQNSEIEIPAQDLFFVVGELIPDDGVDLPDAEHFDRGIVIGHDMCFSGVADEGALDGCHEVGKIGPCDRSDGRRTCSREFSVSLFPFYSFINLVTLESLLLYRFRFSAAEY